MTSPFLWYLNRGTGVVILLLLTATTVLGVLATGRRFNRVWPRFLTQGLHRTLAGLSVAVLTVHVVSAVADDYVDIRWADAILPFGGSYQPFWLGLGTLSLDLMAVVVMTSLLRSRLPHRLWAGVHLLAYASWAVAVGHGVGIGTDVGAGWMVGTVVCCVVAVTAAGLTRLVLALRRASRDDLTPAAGSEVGMWEVLR